MYSWDNQAGWQLVYNELRLFLSQFCVLILRTCRPVVQRATEFATYCVMPESYVLLFLINSFLPFRPVVRRLREGGGGKDVPSTPLSLTKGVCGILVIYVVAMTFGSNS